MTQRSPGLRAGNSTAAISSSLGQCRRVEAGEELRRRNAPLARGAARDDGGIEGHAAGRQLGGGIGVGQRAADGAAVADGGMGDQRHRLGQQRHVPAHQLAGAELGVGGQRADPDAVARRRGCPSARPRARCRSAWRAPTGGRRGWRAGDCPPASRLGVGAGGAPERKDVGKRARPDIGERRRFHAGSSLVGRLAAISGSLWSGGARLQGWRMRGASRGADKKKGESVTTEGRLLSPSALAPGERSHAWSLTGEEETDVDYVGLSDAPRQGQGE